MGVYRGDDLLNERNCKFGKLSSSSCFNFFKMGVLKKKIQSKHKLEEKRRGRGGKEGWKPAVSVQDALDHCS